MLSSRQRHDNGTAPGGSTWCCSVVTVYRVVHCRSSGRPRVPTMMPTPIGPWSTREASGRTANRPWGGPVVSVRQRLHSDPIDKCAPATGSDATPAVILEKVRRSCVGVNRLVLRHATRSTPESLVRSRDTTGVFEKNTRVFYVMPYQPMATRQSAIRTGRWVESPSA
jgi:hypothetical protein